GLAATSYLLDSTRRAYWLRRLFPWRASRNLLVTRPARGERKLRIVLLGHVDAAYTGVVFHPALIKAGTSEPPIRALRFMRRAMLLAVVGGYIAATICVLSFFAPMAWLAIPLGVVTIPSLLAFVFNLDVVLRDQIVPGANDNLTGCVGGLVLADRLRDWRSDDIELVFVATGGEEAGTGGAWALARDYASRWSPQDTVVLA